MANRHKGKGGREKIYGNDQVFASAAAGSKPWAIQKATGGKVVGKAAGGACAPARMDKKARGGRAGGADKSPFSSAAFSKGG